MNCIIAIIIRTMKFLAPSRDFLYLSVLCMLLWLSRSQCLTNYQYLDQNTNVCMPCMYNCFNCYDDATCIQCMAEYYLDSATSLCFHCSFGCAVCNNPNSCQACNDGLYITSDGSCMPCSTGVATCTIAIISTCTANYFLLGSICAGCLTNCQKCEDFVSCSICDGSYYLSGDTSQCLSCGSNCLICSSPTSCTSCQNGYVVNNAGSCMLMNCTAIDPFCVSCNSIKCLGCQQSKYYNGSMCVQGSSILCLFSSGRFHTECDTSNYGCASYSQIQVEQSTSTQLPICLPLIASKLQQKIYLTYNVSNCLSVSCGSAFSESVSYSTRSSYYELHYYVRFRLYAVSTHHLLVALTNANQISLIANAVVVDVGPEINIFNDSESNCGECPYGEKYVSGSLKYSGGSYSTNITITDHQAQFTIIEIILVHSICQVSYCSNCTTAVDCYQCFTPYYLQLAQCVNQCDTGFYLYGRVCLLTCPIATYTQTSSYLCLQCISPCSTCSSPTLCLSCMSGYYLQGGSCVLNCSSSYVFGNSTSNACEKCPNPCISCVQNGNKSVVCLSCSTGYLFTSNICVSICPFGYYGTFLASISECMSCGLGCSSCYLSSTVCLSCMVGFILLDTTCLNATTCPSTIYYTDLSNRVCTFCSYPCRQCATAVNICTSCVKGALFNGSCYDICPSSYFTSYANSNNITCSGCESPCLTCQTSTLCSSCINGYYLSANTCLLTCPALSYASNSSNLCLACVPPCKQCITSTECVSCLTGYLQNTACTLQCNSTSYISFNFICTICLSPCLQCYSAQQCNVCALPSVLNNITCITQTQCSQTIGRYVAFLINNTQGQCLSCTFPCLTCNNTAITCLSCEAPYLLTNMSSTCTNVCQSGYYSSSNNTICLACIAQCETCNSTSSTCLSCYPNTYLLTSNSSCVSSCPSSYFNNNDGLICSLCISPCGQCYNSYLCMTCLVGIYYQKSCISSCPTTTIFNTTTNSCDVCVNNCLTCGSTTSQCQSCNTAYYLYNSTCLQVCPTLTYNDAYSHQCLACIAPCISCLSSTKCLTCISNYFYSSSNSQCLVSCSDGYYANSTDYLCYKCNSTICYTCMNTANGCLICASGYYSYNGSCVVICPNGTYSDAANGICSICPYPCQQCNTYTYCTSCVLNFMLFMNRCYSACPLGYYPATTNNVTSCLVCEVHCQVCSSLSVCLQCESGYYVQNKSCVLVCSIGNYGGRQDITNYDYCLGCQSNCNNCQAFDYCLQCLPTLVLFNGLCLDSCPVFYFTHAFTCSLCSPLCTTCINNTYCLTCIASYLHTHACVVACPNQTYVYASTACMPCKSPCLQCLSDFYCVSCVSDYIYFHNYCVKQCPSDIWYYPSNNSCNAECPYNKYASNMTCFMDSCGDMMVSLSGYCLLQCNEGYYVDQNRACTSCSSHDQYCNQGLFQGQMHILKSDAFTIVIYYNQPAQIFNYNQITVTFIDANNQPIQYPIASYSINQYSLTLRFQYQELYLVNVSVTIPYVRSLSTSQAISYNVFQESSVQFHDYSQFVFMDLIVQIIAWVFCGVIGIMVLINICAKVSHFTQLLDFMQIIAVSLYFEIQYPLGLEKFLSALSPTLFAFSHNLIQIVPYRFSASKYIYYHIDSYILRTQLIPLIIFLVVFIIFMIIIAINTYNPQKLASQVKQIRYRLINNLFGIFLTPLLLFACNLNNNSTVNIVLTVVLAVIGVGYVVWISYKIVQIKKLSQLEGLLGNFERTESKLGLMYTPFGFIRRIVLTFILGIAPDKPISCLTLLLIFTILIMVCVFFYEPFDNQYTDYVTIFMEISLVLYVILLILIGLDVFSPQGTHVVGIFAISLISLTIAICMGWLVYLTVIQIRQHGFCPKNQVQSSHKSEKSYKSQFQQQNRNQTQDKKRSRQNIQIIKNSPAKENQIQDNSANQLLNRFGTHNSDDLFSKQSDNNIQEQFKHWSNSSEKDSKEQMQGKDQALPKYLLKKQIAEDVNEKQK